MKDNLLHFLLVACCFSLLSLSSQSSPDHYGDEEETIASVKSKAKNHVVVKAGVLSLIQGELPIYLEMGIGRRFAIEIGGGLLLPWYIPELGLIVTSGDFDITSPGIGYGYSIQGKKYVDYDAPFGIYGAVYLAVKHYNVGDDTITHSSFGFSQGVQWEYKEKFSWDVSLGLGFNAEFSKNEMRGDATGFSIPILIKFGYVL